MLGKNPHLFSGSVTVCPTHVKVLSTGLAGIFRDSSFDQLSHETRRQWLVRLKMDRAFARIVVLKFVLERGNRGRAHEIEGAVGFRSAEAHEHSLQAERTNLVTNAFLSLWRRRPDGFAKFL